MRWALSLALVAPLMAVEIPAGTELSVRLTDRVASNVSHAKQVVHAVVISPVIEDGRILVPAGSTLTGTVKEATPAADKTRATMLLSFNELSEGKKVLKLSSAVASVDNARETVDPATGKILGILGSETLTSRIDQGINKLSQRYGGFAEVLQAAKSLVVKPVDPEIEYEPGVELTLKLTSPLEIPSVPADASRLQPFPSEPALIDLVNRHAFRTVAANSGQPSDITNLMFIGTEQQLRDSFEASGWSTAAALSGQSKLETARAIIEQRGYKEAPVSTLLWNGQPPLFVFQKGNNTFAQRHHLRIWQSNAVLQSLPVWICSATHDIGIDFSEQKETFIHRIDPRIDLERAKVASDLLFTGKVASLALVGRPEAPTHTQNATGDTIETDGKMVVILFASETPK